MATLITENLNPEGVTNLDTGIEIQESVIFINRSKVLEVVSGQLDGSIQDRRALNIIEKNILHEVIHLAEDQVVSDAKRDSIAEEMGQAELEQAVDMYLRNSPEEAEAVKAELRSEDPEVSVPARRAVVREYIRMGRELRTTGLTTEDVLTYDATAPALMQELKVSLTRFLRKLLARLDTGRYNPELRASAYHVSERLRLMYAEDVELDTIPFDPANPAAGLEHIAKVFSSTTPVTSKSTDVDLQERFEMLEILVDSIEYPVGLAAGGKFEGVPIGDALKPGGLWPKFLGGKKGFAPNWRAMLGRAGQDPRVDNLTRHHERVEQAIKSLISSDLVLMEFFVKKAFGEAPEADVLVALHKASGTTDSLDLTREAKRQIRHNWLAQARRVKKEVREGKRGAAEISEAAKSALKRKMVDDVISRRRAQLIEQARRDQREAEKFIKDTASTPKAGEDLVDHITKIRFTLDQLSKRASKELGLGSKLDGKLAVKFTERLGIYLTRSYRIFNDIAYLDELLKPDGKFQGRRDAAMPFFVEEQIKVWRKVFRGRIDDELDPLTGEGFVEGSPEALKAKAKSELSPSAKNKEAQLLAEQYLKDKPELATEAMDYLLKSYHPKYKDGYLDVRGKVGERAASMSNWARGSVDNLRPKANVDAGLRNLMGQYGLIEKDGEFVEAGVHNLFHTMQRLTSLASSQAFYNNLKTIGGAKDFNEDGTVADSDTGFVLTFKQLQEKNINLSEEPYVHVKTGERASELLKPEDVETKGFSGLFDPTADLFVPERLYKAHKYLKNWGTGSALTDLRKLPGWNRFFDVLAKVYLKANMLSLGTKTLVNFPAYHSRNVLTGTGFYALAAGGPKVMGSAIREMFVAAWNAKMGLKDPRKRTQQEIMYERLGIDLSSWQVNLLTEQTDHDYSQKGEGDEVRALADATTLMESILSGEERAERNFLKKSGSFVWQGGRNITKGTWRRLLGVAQGIDAGTKIAIYKKEKKILENARQYDLTNNVDTGYRDMSDRVIQEKAAEKARALAPTYGEAGIAVRAFRKYSAAIGEPYFAFFADQFRIVRNGIFSLPTEEINSPNPIVRSHGAWRAGWSTFVFVATPAVAILAKGMLGIDPTDDEDEFLVEGAPVWGKRNQFIYVDGDELADMGKRMGVTWLEEYRGNLVSIDLTYVNSSSPVSDPLTASIKAIMHNNPEKIPQHLFEGYLARFGKRPMLSQAAVTAIANATERKDDTVPERISTLFSTLLEQGFEPGWHRKLRQYRDDKKAPSFDPEEDKATTEMIVNMTFPIRPIKVDPAKNLEFITKRHQAERAEWRKDANSWISADEQYTLEEMEQRVRRISKNIYDLDRDLSAMVQASMNIRHGLSQDEAVAALIAGGVSKSRALNLIGIDSGGRPDGIPKSERYIISEFQTNKMLDAGGWMEERIRAFDEYTRKYGGRDRWVPIDDRETPDN